MPNGWINQEYAQGFDGESITLNKSINMFERRKSDETIYGGVL